MNLYEITRKLVARGCQPPAKIRWNGQAWEYVDAEPDFVAKIRDNEARAFWACAALEWLWSPGGPSQSVNEPHGPTILDAIEAATRHLEKPT